MAVAVLAVPVASAAGAGGPARTVASPEIDRGDARATLLGDGTLLVSGGSLEAGSAEVFDPSKGTWSATGLMVEARAGHTATVLGNGRVLVAGGATGTTSSASAEIYDPAGRSWAALPPMAVPRSFHTATLLGDGRVLVVGGQAAGHGPFQREAEVFDPKAGRWSPAGVIEQGRSFHAAVLLADGRVLVTGGQGDPHGLSLRDGAVYDPAANAWSVVPQLMAVGRSSHTMTLLPDASVLVAGGTVQRQGDNDGDQIQASTEIFDPADGSFRPGPAMATPRAYHASVTLPSGRVLVAGGKGAVGGQVTGQRSAEIYDPVARRWVAAGDLPGVGDGRQSATLLAGGRCGAACGEVLVVGQSAQLLSPPAADMAQAADPGGSDGAPLVAIVLAVLALAGGATAVSFYRRRGRRRSPRAVAKTTGPAAARTAAAARRDVALLTDRPVEPVPGRRRRAARAAQAEHELGAGADADQVVAALAAGVAPARAALERLAALRRQRLLGKAEEELSRLKQIDAELAAAAGAVRRADLADAGRSVASARRLLSAMGSVLAVALSQELAQAHCPRQKQADLAASAARLQASRVELAAAESSGPRAGLLAWPAVLSAMAEGWDLAADVLGAQAAPRSRSRKPASGDAEIAVVAPAELETFDDVGGLEEAKAHLRRTVATILDRGAEAAASGSVHNGVLLHGPPGTGKTLLARAVAGEYGLRFLRLSPALVASAYQHEPAKKLRQVFERAAEAAPCLLFLDEVDVIGGRRAASASPDQRELATQLLTSLEDYRHVPGLVIMAATNDLDHLDPALREGRFDSRVVVPLPDAAARAEILAVQLEHRAELVDQHGIDLDALAERTSGRAGAALAGLVAGAAERALAGGGRLGQAELLAEIEARSGTDRAQTLEDTIGWDDVVLPEAARSRLTEILLVFERPELGRSLGVRAPAGVLLHGPPGTGKTTVARALASQVRASFYELSAADVLSKWVGESEQKVAQVFTRARANRPSIIFIDEIDALLRRRAADSASPWEERVVSQFLRELDGLVSSEGVLLVGSTNRPDIIDEAVRDRRLVPIEVPLPDRAGRTALLEGLFTTVRRDDDVDLDAVAAATDGLSGADLKALRDAAGMKALTRAAAQPEASEEVTVTAADLAGALAERGIVVARPTRTTSRRARR